MRGLGDTVYQRAFIHSGYVDTPWPELFKDKLGVKCVKPNTNLRTQRKNVDRQILWDARPSECEEIKIHYGPSNIAISKNIPRAIENQLNGTGGEFKFDLPDFGESPVIGDYAVIKLNTIRSEWSAPARNCKAKYIKEAADALREKGLTVIGVADLEEGKEWIDGVPPQVDIQFYEGELSISQLMALVQNAKVVVSSVGWPVPICLAGGVKLVCVGGGLGRYNHPRVTTDPRMDLDNFYWIEPDNYCMCGTMEHNCDKTISDFRSKFEAVI